MIVEETRLKESASSDPRWIPQRAGDGQTLSPSTPTSLPFAFILGNTSRRRLDRTHGERKWNLTNERAALYSGIADLLGLFSVENRVPEVGDGRVLWRPNLDPTVVRTVG